MPFDRLLIEHALQTVFSAGILSIPAAHYTRIGTLTHFLVKDPIVGAGWGSAWATPVQFLNDRQELSLGLEQLHRAARQRPASLLIRTILDDLLNTRGGLGVDAYQMSFSGNPDELGQWRGYGANGMGCSLVTTALEVHRVADVAGWVLYDHRQQARFSRLIIDGLRGETDQDVIGQTLVAAASFMKNSGFRPEKEFRLLKFPDEADIRFRETGDRLVPYVDFLNTDSRPLPLQVDNILIGPGWQLSRLSGNDFQCHHVVQGIRRLLDIRGLTSTDIQSSQIPYDPQ